MRSFRKLCVVAFLLFASVAFADNVTAPDNFYIGNRFQFGQNGTVLYEQVYSASFFASRPTLQSRFNPKCTR